MTTPMFRAIKQVYPDAYIGVSVMGTAQITILKNNKNVDDIINLGSDEYQGIKGTIKLIRYLRNKQITHSLLNHIAERKRFFTSAFFAGIKTRIGYDRSSATREKTYKYFVKSLTHSLPYRLDEKLGTQLNLEILRFLGITNSDLSYDLTATKTNAVAPSNKVSVGIHAGCDGRAELKRWELEKFIGLGKSIQREFGYEVKFYIGPAEADMAPVLRDQFTLVEGLPLEHVITDISYCNYFISNDSGLAHIAGAFKVPTIIIFGPTLKNEYMLPTTVAVENATLECRPCFHYRKPCPINKLCLRSISVDDVFTKFKQLVAANNKTPVTVSTIEKTYET